MAQDVENPDESELAGVMQQLHPFAREEIAANAEHLQRRTELLQLAHDLGRMQIAGCFAGDNGEFHLYGAGNISQPMRIPPKKSEQKMMRKSRTRSRFSWRHKSAKKRP